MPLFSNVFVFWPFLCSRWMEIRWMCVILQNSHLGNIPHVSVMTWLHPRRHWRCSHSTVIDRQAAVFLQHCVEPLLIAEQDQSWLKAPVRLQVLGVHSSHQQGLRVSWGSLSPSQLSGCLLSDSRARHSLDGKLSRWRDVVSACLCFLYVVNIHKQLHMNINIHEQLFHLGNAITYSLISQEFEEFEWWLLAWWRFVEMLL